MAKTSFTRKQIESNIETDRKDTQEKNTDNERSVFDAEIERKTLNSLEGGTEDGLEEVIENLNQAQDISSNEFEEGTNLLHVKHGEIQEHKDEINDGLERSEKDDENIDSTIAEINSESAKSSLESARESVQQDMELLNESMQQEEQIEEQSNEMNQEQMQRLKTAIGEN
ncbi:MAG: hypothetical protein JXA96_13165 [Sedimentisphaerales bacterium]|nr:hypothetical protein [Sedimentisphaerales bacterium]